MNVNNNSNSLSESLNYFFLSDSAPFSAYVKSGKCPKNLEIFPETQKISTMMKQARILEILAEKFGVEAKLDNMFFFFEETKELQMQELVETVINSLNERSYNPRNLQKENLSLSKDFANSLLAESKKLYDIVWKEKIARQNKCEESECQPTEKSSSLTFSTSASGSSLSTGSRKSSMSLGSSYSNSSSLTYSGSASGSGLSMGSRKSSMSLGSSNSNPSLRSAQRDVFISNKTQVKMKRVQRLSLDSISTEAHTQYKTEKEPLKSRENKDIKPLVDYQDKELLLGQASLLWGYTHGKNQNMDSCGVVQTSEAYKKYEHELASYKVKGCLGQITKEMIEVLLNHPEPKFSALANDICRQMKFTFFNTSNESLKKDFKPVNNSDEASLIASIQHFEYLLNCFANHFSDNVTDFSDVIYKWNSVMEEIKLAIDDKLKDFSKVQPLLEYNHVVQTLTTFLESMYPKKIDLDNPTFLQLLFTFITSMNQNLCVVPCKHVSDALPISLGEITQKDNRRNLEYSFGDHCFTLTISQTAMIENIYNCEINVVTILARNLLELHHPWGINTYVEIGKRKPTPKEGKTKISSEGLNKIKNDVMPSLEEAGFKVTKSLELKKIMDNNSSSFSSLINIGKK